MNFHEVRLSEAVSYGSVFGPEFSTDVVITASGGEQRNQNWAYPRHKGDVAHGVKTEKQLAELKAFFYNRRGKAYGFRFKDWSDFKATNQLIGSGNGLNNLFQLIKKYEDFAGYTSTRIIKKPVEGSVTIYVDEMLVSEGWYVDTTTGIVTFTMPPVGEICADFEFDVPVRFDTDHMPVSCDNFNVYSWNNIPIVELK